MSTPKIFEAAPTTAVSTSALPAQAMLVLDEAGSWPAVFEVFEVFDGFDAAIKSDAEPTTPARIASLLSPLAA